MSAEVKLDDLLSAPGTTQLQRSVLTRAADLAEAGGWRPRAVGTLLAGLHQILTDQEHGKLVRLSAVKTVLSPDSWRRSLPSPELLRRLCAPSRNKVRAEPNAFCDVVNRTVLGSH